MKSLPSKSEETFEDSNLEIVQRPRNLVLMSNPKKNRTGDPGPAIGEQWFKVTTLPNLFEVLQRFAHSRMRYRLVAGNTGVGIYKNDGPYDGYIEVNDIPELHYTSLEATGLILGGGVTLTTCIDQFRTAMSTPGFVYAAEFYKLFRRTACLSVRNVATLAGNLMLKHDHREFVSDVFTLFESVRATLKIGKI